MSVLVLVGPAAVGKSTLGMLLADLLGVPFVDVDELGDQYYREVGWSIDRLVERAAASGHDFLAEWFDDENSRRVATLVVTTNGEAPGATAARLLDHVRKGVPSGQRVAPPS